MKSQIQIKLRIEYFVEKNNMLLCLKYNTIYHDIHPPHKFIFQENFVETLKL